MQSITRLGSTELSTLTFKIHITRDGQMNTNLLVILLLLQLPGSELSTLGCSRLLFAKYTFLLPSQTGQTNFSAAFCPVVLKCFQNALEKTKITPAAFLVRKSYGKTAHHDSFPCPFYFGFFSVFRSLAPKDKHWDWFEFPRSRILNMEITTFLEMFHASPSHLTS